MWPEWFAGYAPGLLLATLAAMSEKTMHLLSIRLDGDVDTDRIVNAVAGLHERMNGLEPPKVSLVIEDKDGRAEYPVASAATLP